MSLNLSLLRAHPAEIDADAVIVAIHEDGSLSEAARALDYLRQASNRIPEDDIASILIGPGELVIHDHHRLVHGRERFNPDFDRSRRYVG